MTEEQAKTKWCPMRRMTEVGNVRIHNTEPAIAFTLNCIGSDCAMWRKHVVYLTSLDDNDTSAEFSTGYCGLAGKP